MTKLEKVYSDLNHALSVLDVLSRADIDINKSELSAFCKILSLLIEPANSLLDRLNCGYSIDDEKKEAV